MTVVCVTGHRPQKLPVNREDPSAIERIVRDAVRWFISETKASWFVSGMAPGVDQWAADEALKTSTQVLAAIPCLDQDKYWGTETRKLYAQLLSRASATHYVTKAPYTKHVMQERNRWMVDQSAVVFAVFDGSPGGTANCVTYALQAKKPLLRFDPKTLKCDWLR